MKTNKLLLVLLVISFALNLTLVGFLVGQRIYQHGFAVTANPMHHMPRWALSLEPERRRALLPMLRQQRQDARTQMRAIRKAHKAVQQAVAAEDFDQAELATSLIELRARLGDSQRTSHDDFVNFVNALTAKERQDLAQQLRRPKGPRHHPPDEKPKEQWRQPPSWHEPQHRDEEPPAPQ